jgi:hypothetical protein
MTSQHTWLEYDEKHRGCPVCGLRVFLSPSGRGWVLVNYYGQPTSNLLADVSGGFGSCQPPAQSSKLVVLIDYTGDPDRFPGCERFMHRIKDEPQINDPSGAGGAAVVLLGSVLPICGFRPTWWELGPPRKHQGWTWCLDCWPEERSGARRSDRKQEPAFARAGQPELPRRPPLPALPAAEVVSKQQRPKPSKPKTYEKRARPGKSTNVVHLIGDTWDGSIWSVCRRRGVQMVEPSSFASLPDQATGKDPRRCQVCLKEGSI